MSHGDIPQQPGEPRSEIAALKALAEDGLGENAPEANARAREKLLQMHRACFAATGHFDLADTGPTRRKHGGWTLADVDAIEWICRLAGAGHLGAHRLLERALTMKHFPTGPGAEERMEQLAKKHPPLARYFARFACGYEGVAYRELARWLDLGGPEAASIAAGVREIQNFSGGAERRILHDFVEQAGRTPRLWSELDLLARRAGLLFEIAQQRRLNKATLDSAKHLYGIALGWFESGIGAGSAACLGGFLIVCEARQRDDSADTALAGVNRWLAAGGDAQSRDPQLTLARGRVRHRGETNVRVPKSSPTADQAIGAKWLQCGALIGDAESQYLLAGLYARGHGVERDKQAARAWMEKAAAGGHQRAAAMIAKIERSVRVPVKSDGDPETIPLGNAAANALSGAEETDELLDLVEVYLKMGDVKFARDMLDNLLLRGNEAQQERANKLFAAIAKK